MESSVAHTPRLGRSGRIRPYLAGSGATAALIAGAIVAFLGVAAFVAFEGMPFGAEDAADATVQVGSDAPEAAALAASAAPAAVAAEPAAPSRTAVAEIVDSLPPRAFEPGANGNPGNLIPDIPGVEPPSPGAPPVVTPPPVPSSSSGALGNTVGNLENTAGNLGLNLPLSKLTGPLTQPLDKAVTGTLDKVGGALGSPDLGTNVNKSLNGLTNGLLGKGGLVDGLLGGGK